MSGGASGNTSNAQVMYSFHIGKGIPNMTGTYFAGGTNSMGAAINSVMGQLQGNPDTLRLVYNYFTDGANPNASPGLQASILAKIFKSEVFGPNGQAVGIVKPGSFSAYTGLKYSKATTNSQANNQPFTIDMSGNGSAYDPTTNQMYNAYEAVDGVLQQWGLGALAPDLYDKVIQNHWLNQSELLDYVRSTDTYKQAFPGLSEYNQKVGLGQALNESEYQQYSKQIFSMAHQYGLGDFMTQQEIGTLISNGVSFAEAADRMVKGYSAVMNGDPQIKDQLQRLYGVNPGQLLQYYFDTSKGTDLIEKQTVAATAAAYAGEVGLGSLDQTHAEKLASMIRTTGSGSVTAGGGITPGNAYDYSQVKGALNTAARDVALTKPGIGTQNALNAPVTNDQLIGGQLAGYTPQSQIQDQRAVQIAEQQRIAPFQKGGGMGSNDQGVYGAGFEKQ